jgi:hypothetical protein
VGSFDVDDRVERSVGEGELLGVSLEELEAVDAIVLLAEVDAGRVEVKASVLGGAEVASDPGGAPAVPTADFQHLLALKVHLRSHVMIKLDAGAIVFVTGLQFQADWRLGFKGIVEEKDTFSTKSARQKGIPQPPDRLAD